MRGCVTANPPTPAAAFCERLLKEVPEYLAPGGMAVVLINWMHTDEESAFEEGPLEWIPEERVRRWLFQSDCSSPADYAWLWIGQDPLFKGESAVTEMKRWLDFYKARGTGAISSGFVVIQKCEEGEEWTRTDSRAVKDLSPAAGGDIYQIYRNETWLAGGVTDDALLAGSYSVPGGLRTTAEMILTDYGWHRETIRLRSPGNLAYDGQIDENLMRLLELCRSGNSPSAMVAELRATPEFAGMPDLESIAAGLVRELVRFGALVPKM